MRRYGPKPKPGGQLFWSRVDVGWTDECWAWGGTVNLKTGYGHWTTGLSRGLTNIAHRVAYMLTKGDPGDLQIDHLCHNKVCCNPQHLEAVSQAENLRRSRAGGLRVYRKATQCKRGHAFTPENTGDNGLGGQVCKTCKKGRASANVGA